MNQHRLLAAALGAAALVGCSTIPPQNADLAAARTVYYTAQADPQVTRYAPVELGQASDTLAAAERAWSDREDEARVGHLAYLAQRRASIAIESARQRVADDQILTANRERDRVLLEARAREAAQAQAAADAERQRALAAQQAAVVASQQANAAEQRAAEIRQQAEAARQQAAQSAQQSAALQQRASAAEAQAQSLQQQLDELKAQPTSRGLVMSLSDVLFDTGRATLKPGAERTLDKLATFLRNNPERRVSVEGFTDSIGDPAFNAQLSRDRAESVRIALLNRGIAPERITATGYGAQYPIASNADVAGRQLNRRVEIVISDTAGTASARSR